MEANIKNVSQIEARIYRVDLDTCKIIVRFGAIANDVYSVMYTNPALLPTDDEQSAIANSQFTNESIDTRLFTDEQIAEAKKASKGSDIPAILWAIFVEIVRNTQKPIP